jgi:hypothetical protein
MFKNELGVIYRGQFKRTTQDLPAGPGGRAVEGYGYNEARTHTTQQSGQTPDREVEIKSITVYVSSHTEADTTGMLSPPTVWRFSVAADIQQCFFISTFLSGVCPDCCVVSVLVPM